MKWKKKGERKRRTKRKEIQDNGGNLNAGKKNRRTKKKYSIFFYDSVLENRKFDLVPIYT